MYLAQIRRAYVSPRVTLSLLFTIDTGNWKSTICTRISGPYLCLIARARRRRSVELISSNEQMRAGVNRLFDIGIR